MKEEAEACPTCGQRVKVGVKVFEGFMANLFIAAVKLSRDTEVVWHAERADSKSRLKKAFLRDVVLSKALRDAGFATRYARLGDLKYWGLLHQDPEWWHQGIYQLTDAAKDFLSGRGSIPKQLLVTGGKVLEASEERIDLRAALGGKWNEIADWITDWRRTHTEDSGQGTLF